MKDILIIAQFTQAPGEFENDRFRYIAERLFQEKESVEVVTMSFSHHMKRQRRVTDEQLKDLPYKMTFIPVPDYQNNVSIKRIHSNSLMGKNLKKYLEKRAKPDVIYCAVPSLDVGYAAAQYARKHKIQFILDVQDLWPEAFKLKFNIPFVSNLIFAPLKRRADYIYAQADEIIAVSQTYADRALCCNKKCNSVEVIYLGTDLDDFDSLADQSSAQVEEKTTIVYVGTLGASYNLNVIIEALTLIRQKGICDIKFLVMGDGPQKQEFEEYADRCKIDAEFTGRLSYAEMVGRLSYCDIAVNPIMAGAAQSIINKHADYAAAGLPVVNTQECTEYRDLLDKFQAGINCPDNSAQQVAEAIEDLCLNHVLRKQMGNNSRRMAEEQFNRRNTYQRICQIILRRSKSNDFLG